MTTTQHSDAINSAQHNIALLLKKGLEKRQPHQQIQGHVVLLHCTLQPMLEIFKEIRCQIHKTRTSPCPTLAF